MWRPQQGSHYGGVRYRADCGGNYAHAHHDVCDLCHLGGLYRLCARCHADYDRDGCPLWGYQIVQNCHDALGWVGDVVSPNLDVPYDATPVLEQGIRRYQPSQLVVSCCCDDDSRPLSWRPDHQRTCSSILRSNNQHVGQGVRRLETLRS